MSVYIRRMREEDIPQAVEIEQAAFTRPWSKSIFKATLLLPYAAYYVAVETAAAQKENTVPEGAGEAPENPAAQESPEKDSASYPVEKSASCPAENSAACPAEDSAGRTAGHSEQVVGICGVKKIFEEGEISNVAVHPDYRGRGISRKMLDLLMREAREDGVEAFTLEVRAGNRIAIRLYESLGFRTEGVRPGFYDKPVEDGLIMWQR